MTKKKKEFLRDHKTVSRGRTQPLLPPKDETRHGKPRQNYHTAAPAAAGGGDGEQPPHSHRIYNAHVTTNNMGGIFS